MANDKNIYLPSCQKKKVTALLRADKSVSNPQLCLCTAALVMSSAEQAFYQDGSAGLHSVGGCCCSVEFDQDNDG